MSASLSPKDGLAPQPPRATRYLLVVVILGFGAVMAQSLISYGLPAVYPFIQEEMALSRAEVGLITSAYAVGFGAAVMFAGWLTDAIGVRRMITFSLVSMTVFTTAFMLVHSFFFLLALSVLLGVLSSPLYPATSRAIMDWVPGRIRAFAMGCKQTGFPVGGALTAALLPTLAISLGWRLAASTTGLVYLVMAVAVIALYRNAPRSMTGARRFSFADLKTILRNRCLVTSIIWGTLFSGLQYIVLTYLMLFLIEELKFSAIVAGGLLALAQVSSSFARVAWGAVSDFVFRARRIAVLAIIGFVAVIWMAAASFITGEIPTAAVYALAIAVGISTLSYPGILTTLIGELSEPGQIGVTVGFASMMNHVSQMLMPPLFGWLVDVTDSYSLGWRVIAALALVCTLALITIGREPEHH